MEARFESRVRHTKIYWDDIRLEEARSTERAAIQSTEVSSDKSRFAGVTRTSVTRTAAEKRFELYLTLDYSMEMFSLLHYNFQQVIIIITGADTRQNRSGHVLSTKSYFDWLRRGGNYWIDSLLLESRFYYSNYIPTAQLVISITWSSGELLSGLYSHRLSRTCYPDYISTTTWVVLLSIAWVVLLSTSWVVLLSTTWIATLLPESCLYLLLESHSHLLVESYFYLLVESYFYLLLELQLYCLNRVCIYYSSRTSIYYLSRHSVDRTVLLLVLGLKLCPDCSCLRVTSSAWLSCDWDTTVTLSLESNSTINYIITCWML
jgi:hypothetical protein